MTLRKVAIVGAAASRAAAPFDDPDFEIWALAWWQLPRIDRGFEMHQEKDWPRYAPPDYAERLKRIPLVYMREVPAWLKNGVPYPFDLVDASVREYGDGDWRTSSIAYMMALAMAEGRGEVHIYGVEMAGEDEYAYQRPGMSYLIGLARGSGMKVELAPGCVLLKSNFEYGLTSSPGHIDEGAITEKILEERLAYYKADRAATQARIKAEHDRLRTLDGAEQEVEQLIAYVRHFKRGGVLPRCA